MRTALLLLASNVFVLFAWLYLKDSPRWNDYAAFLLIFAAVVLANWR